MSAAVAYDTLKIARQLAEAGLDQSVAEGVSETFAGVLGDREDSLATKSDIAELRAATKTDIAELRAATKGDIAELRAATQSEIAALKTAVQKDLSKTEAVLQAELNILRHELRSEFRGSLADQTKWMAAALFAAMGLLFAGMKFL